MEAAERLISLYEDDDRRSADFVVETLQEVAEFFGLAEPTVRQWTQRNPPIPGEAGRWSLKEIVRWREAWLTASDLRVKQQEQAYALGQVKLEADKLELLEKQRQLLNVEDVELWAATAIVEFRETVMQLKEMLTSAAPPEMREFVRSETERHLRDALSAAARRLQTDKIGGDE